MKKIFALSLLLMVLTPAFSFGSGDPVTKEIEESVNTFAEGCHDEMTTFCKDVTPGEGRILACLYAFQDKVSARCEFALYDSISQLDRVLSNLSYVASECSDDFEKHCSEIQPGEGRILECLNKNEDQVSQRCNRALKDVGYKK